MLLADAAKGYLLHKRTRCSPTTIKTDTVLLRQFRRYVGGIDCESITSEIVRGYLSHHRERGLSPHTVRRHLAVISAMFSWLVDVEIVSTNPTDAIAPPKLPVVQPKAASTDDIQKMLDATESSRNKRRDRALLLFLLDSGARASECVGVDVKDVEFESGKVLLRHTKGRKERYIFLGQRSLSALWLYAKDERPEPRQVKCERLFLTHQGYPMTRHTLRGVIKRLAKRAGVDATTHALRHSSAVQHLRNGCDLLTLSRTLGHSQLSTTKGYLSALDDEDRRKITQRTSPCDNLRL